MALLQKERKSFEDLWKDKIQPTILKLLNQHAVSHCDWQDLFQHIHNIGLWDMNGTKKVLAALQTDVNNFISEANLRVRTHKEDYALLKGYIKEWQMFFEQCGYLPEPFKCLQPSCTKPDKNEVENHKESRVKNMMLDCWNSHVFSGIQRSLQRSAMVLVHRERLGESIDPQLIIGLRQSYVNLCSDPEDTLKIYHKHFESAYITATKEHYNHVAANYLSENNVEKYLLYVDTTLREEERRAVRYLESVSVPLFLECLVEVLVSRFMSTILLECRAMIRNEHHQQLRLMFKAFNRVPDGVEPIIENLDHHIVEEGKKAMHASKEVITNDSGKYIEQLLLLYNDFSRLVSEAFMDDPRFLTARDKAFERVVNDHSVFELDIGATRPKGQLSKLAPESRCPELLANYCDMLLRKTPLSKKLSSEEIEIRLKNVLLILKYVSNKDVFMKYHKAHLTRRLILATSADNEKEENMVEWLRDGGMPADYVNKLARMFQDIKVSEDLNLQFKSKRVERIADIVNIKILNAGAWARRSEKTSVSLPTELEDLIPEVEEFYKSQHTGRKLQWHHLMSNGVITFKTDMGQYDLEVTTFQLAVLFAWNQRPRDQISFENLKLATELPDNELRRTLWSLVMMAKAKRQVLVCDSPIATPKDFHDNSLFSINHQYALIKNGKVQKRGRINLIGRLQLSTERTREEDNEGIVQLRILRTQEAIVKILKVRKRISNAQLQTELVEILKNMFLPQKKMIKEQIEWLIEHKYMDRDENDLNTFVYVA